MNLVKYISSLSLVILSGFLLVACEDFLDRQEDEKLTFEKNMGIKKYDEAILVECHVFSS